MFFHQCLIFFPIAFIFEVSFNCEFRKFQCHLFFAMLFSQLTNINRFLIIVTDFTCKLVPGFCWLSLKVACYDVIRRGVMRGSSEGEVFEAQVEQMKFSSFSSSFRVLDAAEMVFIYCSRQLAEHSPYFEMFKSQNREVLFAYEAADETVFLSLPQYRMKQLKSVDNWAKTEGTNEQSTESMHFHLL